VSGLLLDTHAAIWLMEGIELTEAVVGVIVQAGLDDGVYVSPVSAWEIGLLATGKAKLSFAPDPLRWFAQLMSQPIIKPARFDGEIAIGAAFLPGDFHSDPADRLLVATARSMRVPLVTRDRKILAYGKTGHVEVLEC
jgi:PIN domain nuclease of toxin-antitoxin system